MKVYLCTRSYEQPKNKTLHAILIQTWFTHLLLRLAQHVHCAHVDLLGQAVLGVLQLRDASSRLLRVVRLEVVRRVRLAEVSSLSRDPLVRSQVVVHLAQNM